MSFCFVKHEYRKAVIVGYMCVVSHHRGIYRVRVFYNTKLTTLCARTCGAYTCVLLGIWGMASLQVFVKSWELGTISGMFSYYTYLTHIKYNVF
jgi:hypothetical protein